MKRQRVDFGECGIQYGHRAGLQRHHERQLGFVMSWKLQDRVDIDAVSGQDRSQRSNDTRTVGYREADIVRGGKVGPDLHFSLNLLHKMHFRTNAGAHDRHQV